jgi:hypothetical protein
MTERLTRLVVILIASATVVLSFGPVSTHDERPTHPPDGRGHVPTYRAGGPRLLVCKINDTDFERRIAAFPADLQTMNRALYAECKASGYRDLQGAVDQVVEPGTTILVLPGLYQEEPSLLPEDPACYSLPARRAQLGYQILSYDQQKQCPHQQNLVGIFGVQNLQIEGTGASPSDVVFDAQFQKLNVIRGDRSNGLYLANFTAERSTFNAVYVIETDGFVIDRVVGRWNTEYGFLSFASDHGLFTHCEAYGNGDSGIYPGGTSDINGNRGFDVPRYAIEVRNCRSHDNLLGYSGTGGDSVWVHDNELDHNTGGASMDSLYPNHPGLPQNHALFEHNLIHSNNSNYYGFVSDGTCSRPVLMRGIEKGVVCPGPPVPVGVGVLVIGGNYDLFRQNSVYDNRKAGFVQTWVPGLIRGDYAWEAQEQTSYFDRYIDNQMGVDPNGRPLPNGVDYFWDGQGGGNCWTTGTATVEPLVIPACPARSVGRLLPDPNRLVLFMDCTGYDLGTRTLPAGCDWFQDPVQPGGMPRSLNVMSVAPSLQAVVVLVLFGGLAWHRRRFDISAAAAVGAAVTGVVLAWLGSIEQLYFLAPPGIALLGVAWAFAARLSPTRRLAVISVALGLIALLEAVDSAIVLLPTPLGMVWIRLTLECVWVVMAAFTVWRQYRSSQNRMTQSSRRS